MPVFYGAGFPCKLRFIKIGNVGIVRIEQIEQFRPQPQRSKFVKCAEIDQSGRIRCNRAVLNQWRFAKMAQTGGQIQSCQRTGRYTARYDFGHCSGNFALSCVNALELSIGIGVNSVNREPVYWPPECIELDPVAARRIIGFGRACIADKHQFRFQIEIKANNGYVEIVAFNASPDFRASGPRK